MYNSLDYKHDRHRVRERFVKHVNKKTTIQDIGLLLDKWTLDSKGKVENWTPERHILEQPEYPQKDHDQGDFYWEEHLFKELNPVKPSWLDDSSEFIKLGPF